MVVALNPETKEIEILRAGSHVAMNGTAHNFTSEILDEIVSSYNPDNFKAPLIVSHKTGDYSDRDIVNSELAFGFPKFLKRVGDRIKAVFEKISPQFVEWVRNHQILGISPSFYPPGHPSNPTPSKWSLRHIAGLGASPPAIKGMATLSLSEFLATQDGAINLGEFDLSEDAGTVVLDFMGSDRSSIYIFQRLRDYFIDKESLEAADRIIPPDYLQMLSESASMPDYQSQMLEELMMRVSQLEAKVSSPEPIYTEKPMTEEKEKELDFAERQRQLEIQQADLVKQAQKLAARQAELDRKEDLDFAEGLIKEGRALPAEKEKLITMMGAMRSSEVTVNFGENDKPPMLDAFKDMLSKRPPVIALGEHAKPEDKPKVGSVNFSAPDGFEVDQEALEIHEQAIAYMEQHPGTTYMTAVKKVGAS